MGVYDLPPLPPSASLVLTSTNSSPAKGGSGVGVSPVPLPIVRVSLPSLEAPNGAPQRPPKVFSTSLPTSRHPTRSSFRYDETLTLSNLGNLNLGGGHRMVLSVVIPKSGEGGEDFVLGTVAVKLGELGVGKEVDHLFTIDVR